MVAPPPTFHKNDDIDLNIDMTSVLENIYIHVPLTEITKIPSLSDKVKKLQSIQDESKDPPVILKVVHYDGRNGGNEPFFISLVVNNLLLHNCMLDTRDSTIVMSLKDMDQLGLKITRPYRNVCGIDSKNIKVCVLTKDLKVSRHISLNGCCSYSCA
jgi:hypothetical protein